MNLRSIPAGVFKQGCLAILDDVAATHREVVITKRGRPVARLVLASLRGRAKMLVSEREFLRPLTAEAGWRLGDDE
jgi:prevent-host-death family protein